jgi:DNA-binding CsgD family transcriptional regulator
MELNQCQKTQQLIARKERFEKRIFKGFKWDPLIEDYHVDSLCGVEQLGAGLKCNQFRVLVDLYQREVLSVEGYVEELIGVKRDEFRLLDLFNRIHHVDRQIVFHLIIDTAKCLSSTKDLEENKDVFLCDFRVIMKGECIRLLNELTCLKKDRKGNPLVLDLLFTDITGLKDSQRVGYRMFTSMPKKGIPCVDKIRKCCLFSNKEMQVLEFLAKGMESSEIAKIMFISRHTVDVHRRKLLQKSMCKNTIQLIDFARRNGFL